MIVYRLGSSSPVRLAARDLARCLRGMTGAAVEIRPARCFTPEQPGVYVGERDRFLPHVAPEDCPADAWDDALVVRSFGGALALTGSNPRSALFAAYRWLEALGARWVRPGRTGEYLPRIPEPALSGWDIREKAASRHRGIVIEGNCFIEQVLEVVDWMPKLRMNAYMLQFRVSAYFWRRWYERTDLKAIRNPHLLTLEECAALDARVADAVKARGLLLHRVGHGWTCEAVGNHGSGWEQEGSAPAAVRPLLAEVNGTRDWYGGIPLNTELCYSNPEARRRFVDEVIRYAVAHPEVDVLHVWASDGTNNWCECPACAALQPSDWYVSLLNEISPRLAAAAPGARLVGVCYSNTMWPPEQVPPAGLGRNLIFMFAPIARCYAHPILDARCAADAPLPRFRRNRVVRPRANADLAAMLRAWQQYLPAGTDSFVFDYHFWWPFPKDLLGTDYVRMLHADVRQYAEAGVNGVLNCQIQRTSMPTAFAQMAMAAYLWDSRLTVEEFRQRAYPAAFGPAADAARAFLEAFVEATGACGHENKWWRGVTANKASAVRRVLREHAPRIREALRAAEHPVHKLSLKLLAYYIRYQAPLWKAMAARAAGRPDAADLVHQTIAFLQQTEPRVYRWMDTHYFVRILRDEMLPEWAEEDKRPR